MTAKERVQVEQNELQEKIEKLQKFINTDNFYKLCKQQQTLLDRQYLIMKDYDNLLSERLAIWE